MLAFPNTKKLKTLIRKQYSHLKTTTKWLNRLCIQLFALSDHMILLFSHKHQSARKHGRHRE